MDEWDYLYVTVLESLGERVQQVMVDGVVSKYPEGQMPILQEFLEVFRRDGWVPLETEGTRTYIFKRPREAKQA